MWTNDASLLYYAATGKENVNVIVPSVGNRRLGLNRGYNALCGERRDRARVELLPDPPAQPDPQAELLRAEERAFGQCYPSAKASCCCSGTPAWPTPRSPRSSTSRLGRWGRC